MEQQLKASNAETTALLALNNTLQGEKKRLTTELKRFVKRPQVNIVEAEIMRKNCLVKLTSHTNKQVRKALNRQF